MHSRMKGSTVSKTPDFKKLVPDHDFEDESEDQEAGYRDPRVGDKVHMDSYATGKVSGVIRAVYADGNISVALDNDNPKEILDLFVRHPGTGLVHIIAEPREYEIYGRVGGWN